MTRALDPQKALEPLVVSACEELFALYGIDLERLEDDAQPEGAEFTLGSVIGFSGKAVRGTLVLALTGQLPGLSNPIRTQVDGAGRTAHEDRDWVGELSNQLLGRIKSRLLRRGVEIYAHLPAVLQGRNLAPLPRVELKPLQFAMLGGVVAVWLEVDTTPGFSMDPSDNGDDGGPSANHPLIFE
jgi:hypothetical protein